MREGRFGFLEFFAGGGLARLGLGAKWTCLMANDICEKKAASYRANFEDAEQVLRRDDVANLKLSDMPEDAELAWASFPCQDLSLAGNRRGLRGSRSGTFWPFWDLMQGMVSEGRPVPIVVLENVAGAITSHGGNDFRSILGALADQGYRSGAMVIDAVHFVPQSRPRLFVLAVHGDLDIPPRLMRQKASEAWHPRALVDAHAALPSAAKEKWIWWNLPVPRGSVPPFGDLVEDEPTSTTWHTAAHTKRLLSMMSRLNREKVRRAQEAGGRVVGTVYRRTRPDENGKKVQRAEVRFDQISGCLRTPVGGSSRQTVLVVEGSRVRSRLLSTREAARIMGVPDTYELPVSYNEAYHLMGDGVVVPVVSWLERRLLMPLARARQAATEVA